MNKTLFCLFSWYVLLNPKNAFENEEVYVMSDGVPTRQGRVARQTKVFFESPGKEIQEFCLCEPTGTQRSWVEQSLCL